MNKHTPDPWLFRGKSNGVFTAPPADTAYTYGDIIFQFDDVAEPIDADLALVLAAPDLLEALEALIEDRLFYMAGDTTGKMNVTVAAYEAARGAIQKARGGL